MKIVSIEPTPSPHSMKVNIDKTLPEGENQNFQDKDDLSNAPEYIQSLFEIEGVKGLYQVQDFITIQRNPRIRWEVILPKVQDLLGSTEDMADTFTTAATASNDPLGQINIFYQMSRKILMQGQLPDGETEERLGLPEHFTNAVMEASEASDNMLMERKWVEQSPRYGDMKEIGNDVVEEL